MYKFVKLLGKIKENNKNVQVLQSFKYDSQEWRLIIRSVSENYPYKWSFLFYNFGRFNRFTKSPCRGSLYSGFHMGMAATQGIQT